ncbi:MAG: response regulator [Thermoanaerobaculia bacterium]|nr:response regulator [Thermoanaerobaculia bacterium]
MLNTKRQQPSVERPRILVVDDEDMILRLMERFFQKSGYEVDLARERNQAETLLENHRYDLVVTDLGVTDFHEPGGLEILELGRRPESEPKLIILTGDGRPEVERECLGRGAHLFLSKPQPLDQLGQAVSGLLEN